MPTQSKQIALPRIAQNLDFTCGAACFESMCRYFTGHARGELYYAEKLGTIALGYTSPEAIATLASEMGFVSRLERDGVLSSLRSSLADGKVIFITWWDVDAGHYSLIKKMDENVIVLMDPWAARDNEDTALSVETFESLWKQRGAVSVTIGLPEKDLCNLK